MNLFEKACEAITEYINEHEVERNRDKTRLEVIDIARKKYPEIKPDGSNMSPSDICYNYCNGYQMTKDFQNWPHALEKIDKATYRLLGVKYPYDGNVLWNNKKSGKTEIFGMWKDGKFYEENGNGG